MPAAKMRSSIPAASRERLAVSRSFVSSVPDQKRDSKSSVWRVARVIAKNLRKITVQLASESTIRMARTIFTTMLALAMSVRIERSAVAFI